MKSLLLYFLIPYLAIVGILVLLFSWFIHSVLFRQLREEYINNNNHTLNQYVMTTERNISQLRTIQDYILLEPEIQFTQNLEDISRAISTIRGLAKYQRVNQNIEDIYLHFHGDHYVYSSSTTMPLTSFFRHVTGNDITLEKHIQNSIENGIPRSISFYPSNNQNKILNYTPVQFARGKADLFISIDLTDALVVDPVSSYLVFDHNRELVAAENISRNFDMQSIISNLEIMEEADESYRIIKIGSEDEEYIMNKKLANINSWQYVYLTPISHAYESVFLYQMYFVFILLAVMLVAILVIYIGFRWNYKPISEIASIARAIRQDSSGDDPGMASFEGIKYAMTSLASENENLQLAVQNINKVQFLQQLLRGTVPSKLWFDNRVEDLGLENLKNSYYGVLVIRFSNIKAEDHKNYSLEDFELKIQEHIPGYLYPLSEMYTYCYLVSLDKFSPEEDRVEIEHVHQSLQEQFQCDVLISVSRSKPSYMDIPQLYLDSYLALQRSFLTGSNYILYPHGEYLGLDSEVYQIPEQIFTRIRYNLERGILEEVHRAIEDLWAFIHETHFNVYFVRGLSYQLMHTIYAVKRSLVEGIELQNFEELTTNPVDLMQLNTVQEIFSLAKEMTSDLCQAIRANESVEEDLLAQEMKDFIDNHFTDSNFSVQRMADEFHMSLSNVSQYFKKHNKTNISEYLSHIRMEHAKELLIAGQYSVKEVSNMVGYLNTSSFIRKFKSIYGITPLQYAESINKER